MAEVNGALPGLLCHKGMIMNLATRSGKKKIHELLCAECFPMLISSNRCCFKM